MLCIYVDTQLKIILYNYVYINRYIYYTGYIYNIVSVYILHRYVILYRLPYVINKVIERHMSLLYKCNILYVLYNLKLYIY